MKTKSENVKFKTKDDAIEAYLAAPDDNDRHPGVIMIHEIFGLDDHTKNVADRLAAEGYTVLAPHLFSSKKLSASLSNQNIAVAMKFMMSIPVDKQRDEQYRANELAKLSEDEKKAVTEVNQILFMNRPTDLFVEYMSSGVDYLHSLPNVGEKIGSVGFCFGGGMSINLGCTGKTDASVIFYGENPNPIEKINGVKGAVMGLYGGEDSRINAGIHELVKALVEYKKPFTVKVFPGAHHAFFNDTREQHYNKQAAEEAWQMLLRFYNTNLR
jgi:carboxymethylenebutenolidase